ncbi:hypothetical protein [Achromobacter kerstersii]|uniref:Uncharacterized protein n=1 Tax=Achromobacter kerstersii TaxID=1353890 RepID=A0A6S6ZJ27_9BURK|nr:hypothetical protein [Achromobacter kerstersii]CAB3681223.1 hypothetical protein LMG3441_01605 [Achromobacter kerstersii]
MTSTLRNAISASPPHAEVGAKATTPAITARRLADMVAPRDHAGKGAWDNNASIPAIAWLYAALFSIAFLVVLPWLGRGAGF